MREIQLRDAKANLSAVVDDAVQGKPAIITRHGRRDAVILSFEEWRQLTHVPSFGRLLMSAPAAAADIPKRSKAPLREVDLRGTASAPASRSKDWSALWAPIGARHAWDNKRIKVLAAGNPRRSGTWGHQNFRLYRDGATVVSILETSPEGRRAMRHIQWDVAHGFIKLV
jgi:prevent-host-death family protein